ncbi:MAG: Ldh family oxidoreductase [Tyzzerella sp.]|nr:Ldh family oxidoreductase [Tyzzerella sp.]
MKRFQIDVLKDALIKLLDIFNVPCEQASTLINCMIEADMRGIHTHGLSVLPAYIHKIASNGFNIDSDIAIIKTTASFTTVDANNLIGAVSAKTCMEIAIDNCMESGMHIVFCKNANTFGPAFYYSQMATNRKLIGICMSNSPSAMPTWGGKKKLLGTNPFSIAVPSQKSGTIIIDMATSIVAKSKINEIRKNGGKLPEGWAVDENGLPTTEPLAAIKGMIMPMAAHKGSAIAIAIDILSGVLSGAAYQNNVNRFYSEDNKCMNVGQCFIAINPTVILDDSFYQEMDQYILNIHNSGDKVLYPGERGNMEYAHSIKHGVHLHQETVDALEELFQQNGIKGAFVEHER